MEDEYLGTAFEGDGGDISWIHSESAWSLSTSALEIYACLGNAVRQPIVWLAALSTDNSNGKTSSKHRSKNN